MARSPLTVTEETSENESIDERGVPTTFFSPAQPRHDPGCALSIALACPSRVALWRSILPLSSTLSGSIELLRRKERNGG